MNVREWLSNGSAYGITLEAAKALETHYNATAATPDAITDNKIYHKDLLPGMFYRVINYSGSGDFSEPVENLVKNISVRYDSAGDDLIIEYTLRSTQRARVRK